MSDFNTLPSPRVPHTPISANAHAGSWRQVLKNAMEQSTLMRFRRGQSAKNADQSPRPSRRPSKLVASLVFIAIGAVLTITIIHFAALPSPSKRVSTAASTRKSFLSLTPTDKPKPAPGKPFAPAPQSHLPLPTVWTQAQPTQQPLATAVVPQPSQQAPATSPAPAPLAGAPAQPTVSAKSGLAPLIYPARHDKHFGGGCAGQLTLSAAGLSFQCPDDPSASLQFPLNQIGAVDDNGIQLLSGKKYHFSIAGMSKAAEQQLFANWLHQVR